MVRSRFKKIKGTKDFMVAAVACTFLCLWSIRDAWFPTKKILEKHPQEFPVSMEVSGVIKSLPVKVGREITGETVLASVYEDSYQKAVETAEAEFNAAKETGDLAVVQEKLDKLMAAREDLKNCTLKNTDIMMTTSHGEDALRGVVLEHLVKPATQVEAGDPIMLVEPHDTFYDFNKTLAILSFIGAIASLYFHWVASK